MTSFRKNPQIIYFLWIILSKFLEYFINSRKNISIQVYNI